MLASLIANALSDGQHKVTPLDFMPTLPEQERKRAVEAAKSAQPTAAERNMAEFEKIFEATFGEHA